MISRAVILQNGKILLIHRFNAGKEFFVLPGGHIEKGESEEDALVRELKEETSLDVQIDKKLWTLENPSDGSKHHFFLVTRFTGKLRLSGPEAEKNSETDKYVLEWHDLSELTQLKLLPDIAKKMVLAEFVDV